MSKWNIWFFLLVAIFCACKSTSTNPGAGQKLRLITSDLDTAYDINTPVTYTLTVLDGTGYGVSGAYVVFYDPVQKQVRRLGPTPENGEWQFTDTIPNSIGGGFLNSLSWLRIMALLQATR